MPMDTALSEQQNKPAFGTNDFAVSPVDSSAYIDAAAEETCPAESAPVPAPQPAASEITEAPSAATLDVMDQLKALAHNVTQAGHDSSIHNDASLHQDHKSEDEPANDAGESQVIEPSINVFPRPTAIESNAVANDRPKRGRVFTLAGLAAAVLLGAGGAFAWQAHLKSIDLATAAAPAPVPPAPIIAPYLGRQLEELSDDIGTIRRDMEALAAKQRQLTDAQKQLDQLAAKQQQLAAKQEQVNQSIAKLHALEQARQKAPAPVQTRAAPVPQRPYTPPPPIDEPAMLPPPPPRTAAHPIPPAPIPPP
jgi:hypothetical protein